VLARISAPRFFRRFLHLGGVCADSAGIERELWKSYRLTTGVLGDRPRPGASVTRVFASTQAKLDALVGTVANLQGAGKAAVVAARTQATARTLLEVLAQAGFKPALIRGIQDESEHAAISVLRTPGTVTVSMHPGQRSVPPGAGPAPCVLIAEAHDSARQVAHLLRAYEPYRSELLISVDEEPVAAQLAGHLLMLATGFAGDTGEFPPGLARWLAKAIQKRLERTHRILREETQALERHLEDLLAFGGVRD
jgi:hypothetical protein